MSEELSPAIQALKNLTEDSALPKGVRVKVIETITSLESDKPLPYKVSRAMESLEQISENLNLQSFIRTEIFEVVSQLESLRR